MGADTSSGGTSICGLLTVAFVVLKLTNVIAWSWWWVLSPIWIPIGVGIIIGGIMLAIMKANDLL